MKALIDTIFSPVLNWLTTITNSISDLSVPVSRPLEISNYFGAFAYLSPQWQLFITTVCMLSFIYIVAFVVVTQIEVLRKIKDLIKWW